ncbi:MAG: methionine--tRNA ligase subunit beta, partial [Thermococcus sp.]
NDYGNLLYRIAGFRKKRGIKELAPNFNGEIKAQLEDAWKKAKEAYFGAMEDDDPATALSAVSDFVKDLNKLLTEWAPWSSDEDKRDTALYYALDGLRLATMLLAPVAPSIAKKVASILGEDVGFGKLEVAALRKGVSLPDDLKPLFPRVDIAKYTAEVDKVAQQKEEKKAMKKKEESKVEKPDVIDYEQFAKVDLRVGKVLKAENHPNADKLLKLTVDLGEGESRTILAGLKQWYKPEDLEGKLIIVVANLKPRKMRGILSQGMLLAATDSSGRPVILTTLEEVEPGAKVK